MPIDILSLASALAAHANVRQEVIAENVAHADTPGYRARDVAAFGAETPNGNSVSLEDQMMRAAEVRQEHDLAIGTYAKSMEILRSTISRR